jgi:hypothetical protein
MIFNLIFAINPLIALGVVASTAATDAAYVFFTAAVTSRRRVSWLGAYASMTWLRHAQSLPLPLHDLPRHDPP